MKIIEMLLMLSGFILALAPAAKTQETIAADHIAPNSQSLCCLQGEKAK